MATFQNGNFFHDKKVAKILAAKIFLSPPKWQLFCDKKVATIWHAKISCHNFGSKILAKSPEMATFEMAAKFWQADE